jgi:short-subunit dehydrogenase
MIKKAFITGASSGIGREIALQLADRGVELIVHGRDLVTLQLLVDEIGSRVPVRMFLGDLASFHTMESVLKMLQEELPDVVINNAGFGFYGDMYNHTPQEMQQMIAVNCAAVVAICQHIAFWWQHAGCGGTILNVSSALSFMPSPGASVYGATKAFVNSFSQALDVELEEHGIRVLTACPGRVATHFATRASKGKVGSLPSGGMILDPQEVAKAIIQQIETKTPLQIINWKYRVLLFIRSLFPRRAAMKALYRNLKKRT